MKQNKYPTFKQDTRMILLPNIKRILQMTFVILTSSVLAGGFFVGIGKLISTGLSLL